MEQEAVAHAASEGGQLINLVGLLAAAVVAVPVFKRLGLGSVLGYLAAGVVIGPFGVRLFTDPASIVHTAELGVVLLLFVIGLEMKPSRLWALRRDIFGLGAAQVLLCGALMTAAAALVGMPPIVAFLAAMGFVLSSTAIVMQILEERGDTTAPYGQKIVSILLLEDLAIVPLLAIVAFLTPGHEETRPFWLQIVTALMAVAGVIFAGRYILNPLFRVLALTRAREIMTAAALLVVLGAAVAMEAGGLSMAMGAFIAGVVLSESSFRHQLEADIEPFRGLLLGLFFLGVGMSLDLSVVASDWPLILAAVAGFMSLKMVGIYVVARLLKSDHVDSLKRALLLAQGGEFAFVLYTAAGGAGLFDAQTLAILTAAVIISMALTPLAPLAFRLFEPAPSISLDGVDSADGLTGKALMIGFGRVGQIAAQALLARGVDTSIIDADPDMIRSAARFGFKIYYGDGTRLDVLHAAGAHTAKIIVVAIDDREAATRIAELAKETFPLAQLFVRAYDRGHSIALAAIGVDFEIRETFESAMALGEAALMGLGFTAEEAAETKAEVRRRDAERLRVQIVEGSVAAGRDLILREPVPTPLVPVKRESRALTEETAKVAAEPVPTGDPADKLPVS